MSLQSYEGITFLNSRYLTRAIEVMYKNFEIMVQQINNLEKRLDLLEKEAKQ